jgi:hypothetical protein
MNVITNTNEKFTRAETEFHNFCQFLMNTESYQLITNRFNSIHRNLISDSQEDLIFFFINQNAKHLNVNVKHLVGKLCVALKTCGEKVTAYRIAEKLLRD